MQVSTLTRCTTWYKADTNIVHRTDGPAKIFECGQKEWFLNGKLHRSDGPAVEFPDGDKLWFIDGKLHRTDGPAVECNGQKKYYIDGKHIASIVPVEFIARKRR